MNPRILVAVVVLFFAACGSKAPTSEQPVNETPITTGSGADPATAACTTDADCRLFSDYCTGCDCRALAKGEPDPTCAGPGVRCIADPCGTQTAVCNAGTCTAVARTP